MGRRTSVVYSKTPTNGGDVSEKDEETTERDPQQEGQQGPAKGDDEQDAQGQGKKDELRAKRPTGGADARNVGG